MEQAELTETIRQAQDSFPFFVKHVFSKSFEHFISGAYIDRISEFYAGNKRTIRVAPRDHFKSTGIYAFIMWQMFQPAKEDVRFHYFSYEQSMAQYHIGKIRELIRRNPFFQEFRDLKSSAEGVAKYKIGAVTFAIIPHGMLSFKKGIHDKFVVVDDPFQEPASKLEPQIVLRINTIMRTQILDMVMRGGCLHCVGTPQTTQDFFFDEQFRKQFSVLITPAIVSEPDKIALWPEWMDWEELMKRRALRGDKIFNQEYCCRPAYAEDSFFKREQLLKVIDSSLRNKETVPEGDILTRIGGWDIGKKTHPAHFTVLEEGADGLIRQVHQQFFDGWDYTRQLEAVKEVCDRIAVDKVYYDDTRGELEALKEKGEVPGFFRGITFSIKSKHALANAAYVLATSEPPVLRLQADERQLNQLLTVTNDLDAMETQEGHGDCFWSLGLAAWGFSAGPKMVSLAGLDEVRAPRRRELFDEFR